MKKLMSKVFIEINNVIKVKIVDLHIHKYDTKLFNILSLFQAIRSLKFQIPIFWSQEPVTTISLPTKTGLVTLSSWNTKLAWITGFPYWLQFQSLTDPSLPLDSIYF